MLEWGAHGFLMHRRGMLRGGAKKGRFPKKTAGGSWKRTGGHWISLVSFAPDPLTGTAAIEVGDIIVPDASKGLVQGDHGLAHPWYDTAVPVMFVIDSEFTSWKKATAAI